jgi:hypothetical protein
VLVHIGVIPRSPPLLFVVEEVDESAGILQGRPGSDQAFLAEVGECALDRAFRERGGVRDLRPRRTHNGCAGARFQNGAIAGEYYRSGIRRRRLGKVRPVVNFEKRLSTHFR